MEKIIVEVLAPGTEGSFDFELPLECTVEEAVHEMILVLQAAEQNISFDHELPILCDITAGRILGFSEKIAQTGVRDGARLMLL